jgi:protein involved in polysaccharide export with SLBB domain
MHHPQWLSGPLRCLWLAFLVCLGLGLAACASNSPPLPPELAQQSASVYRLGLGDKVRINVYGERELSGEYQVSANGSVAMPLVGDVPAVGLSARELEQRLVERYRGYLKDPKIAVEVYDFRPYFVLGEVERPGQYPAQEGTTLLGAIATAGGFTYRADRGRVFIRRGGDGKEYQVDPTANVMVAPGDVIRVGERYF